MKRAVAGYLNRWSFRPGDEVSLFASSDCPGEYELAVSRLSGCDSRGDPGNFRMLPVDCEHPKRIVVPRQLTCVGSHLVFEFFEAPIAVTEGLTFSMFIYVETPPKAHAAIASFQKDELIIGLGVDGKITVEVGPRTVALTSSNAIPLKRWLYVSLNWDSTSDECRLLWQSTNEGGIAEPRLSVVHDAAPCRLPFAFIEGFQIGKSYGSLYQPLSAKIEAPALHHGSLGARESRELVESTSPAPRTPTTLAAWDLSTGIGTETIFDVVGRRHGRTINQPLRAVKGRLWNGCEHDWRHAPHHYAAIHIHEDAIVDAGWMELATIQLPFDMTSGVYAIQLGTGEDKAWMPFFVLPPKERITAPVAYLAPTASYLAYANTVVPARKPEHAGFLNLDRQADEFLLKHPEFGFSLYETHVDGSGIALTSWRRPVINMAPGTMNWGFTADGDILSWLDKIEQPVDVLTDDILDREGVSLLRGYRVIVTATHPEYWSSPMMEALQAFLSNGGRLIYMGGNGFYWRVSFHPAIDGIMEVRRCDDSTRGWRCAPGEYVHSFDGQMGGIWRNLGKAPQQLVGVGFAAQGFDEARAYVRLAASHEDRVRFLFEGVEDEIIGGFGTHGGGAAGEEVDRADPLLGTPSHALCLATSQPFGPGMLKAKEEMLINARTDLPDSDIRADLVFFETSSGGAVFSTGSISWAGALSFNRYDNNVCAITTNCLRRFINGEPFSFPNAKN